VYHARRRERNPTDSSEGYHEPMQGRRGPITATPGSHQQSPETQRMPALWCGTGGGQKMGDQLKRVYVAGNGLKDHSGPSPIPGNDRGGSDPAGIPAMSGLCPGIRGGQGGRMRPNGGGADRCCVVFCGYSVGVIGDGMERCLWPMLGSRKRRRNSEIQKGGKETEPMDEIKSMLQAILGRLEEQGAEIKGLHERMDRLERQVTGIKTEQE